MLRRLAQSNSFRAASSGNRVFVVGVGMTKFEKPGSRKNFDYPEMSREACQRAMEDAGIKYDAVEFASVGYAYGDSTCGQRALYELGTRGIPIYNVNNACASGSSALLQCKQLVQGGIYDVALALGFEKMKRGSLPATYWPDRALAFGKHMDIMEDTAGLAESIPHTLQFSGNSAKHHMEKYGTKKEHFTAIAVKNRKHAVNNPYSQFQSEMTPDQVEADKPIYGILNRFHCCPTSDGAGAAILMSEKAVKEHGLESQAVEIIGQAMATDMPGTFEANETNPMQIFGYEVSKESARQAYEQAGIKAEDVDVCELHDCFTSNELVTYEALGLCPEGKAGEYIEQNKFTYGGTTVVNPSGGLLSKGHPLGATGLAQCAELCWQVRGEAGKRQVEGAKVALQHNLGLGSAIVCTLYRLGFPEAHQAELAKNGPKVHPMPIQGEMIPKKAKK